MEANDPSVHDSSDRSSIGSPRKGFWARIRRWMTDDLNAKNWMLLAGGLGLTIGSWAVISTIRSVNEIESDRKARELYQQCVIEAQRVVSGRDDARVAFFGFVDGISQTLLDIAPNNPRIAEFVDDFRDDQYRSIESRFPTIEITELTQHCVTVD